MNKILTLLIALSFLIFGGACFTSALYDNPAEDTRNFVEEVSTFLITQDGKSLIVAGKQHHYIFAINDTLKFILNWSEKKRIKTAFQNFAIRSNQSVSGMYTLTVNDGQDLAPEIKKLLLSKGFSENKSQNTLEHHGWLQGTRYLADKFKMPAAMQLNQKYSINMTEYQPSASAIVKRILLTPLAVAADGALIVIGGGLAVMAAPFMLFP